jgi:hypothetical protein
VFAKAWTLDEARFKVELSTDLGGVYPANGDRPGNSMRIWQGRRRSSGTGDTIRDQIAAT